MFASLLPLKKKVVIIATFEENANFLLREFKNQESLGNVILLHEYTKRDCQDNSPTCIHFSNKKPLDLIKAIYYIGTSKTIILDNYFAFLSVIKVRKGVEFIQIWHAAGAIKHFGLLDKSVVTRSQNAKNRFIRVYEKFDKVVVGSEKMVEVFKEAFQINEGKFLRTGVPRTDIFYNHEIKELTTSKLYEEYPQLQGKKVILYSPTYRDGELSSFKLKLDLKKMKQLQEKNYFLIMKLHPAIKHEKGTLMKDHPDFILDLSHYRRMNDLLLITDILVTDYSSIPFEFALRNKPMVFFPYDLKEYQLKRGIFGDYLTSVPGPVAYTTEELITIILNDNFPYEMISKYSEEWNTYSTGNSSRNLVHYVQNRTN